MDHSEKLELDLSIGNVFRPSSPIDEKGLFAGRSGPIRRVIDAIFQRGQHVIIYGERGVGKTSLANVISEFMEAVGKTIHAPHITCDRTDDFTRLWKKIFGEIQIVKKTRGLGFMVDEEKTESPASDITPEKITPNDVRLLLSQLGQLCTLIVIIDEYDRLRGKEIRELFADTIKTLSDHAVPATIVLVGVAESVSELLNYHQSVERSLVQIHMPRMLRQELEEIVLRGVSKIGMSIDEDPLRRLTSLSRGLPHYTHLISLYSARAAIDNDSKRITEEHVNEGISRALGDTQQSIRDAYYKATMSTRQESLYPSVLLACALAKTDEFGCFAAGDLREQLGRITGKPYSISNYSRHLKDLCEEVRGPILKMKGMKHRIRFHFYDPLMQPFILMKGYTGRQVPIEILDNHPLF
ncbi:MAG: orc1/cdc6 family replication initiation protein [Nitrospira sp.]|nr:orc1/cdc6 family replication initiation protein [Nitrospira sp.]MBX3336772.1 orc1/cdc6 family replication initiation protein [Nitrospira sp.]MCW5778354.1 orc1/cdc6 family replication initiation protein [Nitrospira sp.]